MSGSVKQEERVSERCSEWSHDGRMSWQCNRPVKAEGMCAQHLAGKRRREENDRKQAEEWRAAARVRESAEDACRRLAEDAIEASPEYSTLTKGYTGRVSVDPAVLFSLLEATRRAV